MVLIMMDNLGIQEDLDKSISRIGRITEYRALELMQEYTRRLSILPRNVFFLD